MPARLSVAAGSAVTLVSSCDGKCGGPELHRWCQGRAPPVSWPSCRLHAQTGSKRSKVGAEMLHMIDTVTRLRNTFSFSVCRIKRSKYTILSWYELVFLMQNHRANEGSCIFFSDIKLLSGSSWAGPFTLKI